MNGKLSMAVALLLRGAFFIFVRGHDCVNVQIGAAVISDRHSPIEHLSGQSA